MAGLCVRGNVVRGGQEKKLQIINLFYQKKMCKILAYLRKRAIMFKCCAGVAQW